MSAINIVARLREKQEELGSTQAELAEMLDVSEGTISRVYSGRRNPGRAVIMGMLKVWPDVFSENGGGDEEPEGDGGSGDAGDDRAGDPDGDGDSGDAGDDRAGAPVALRAAGAPAAVGTVE
ncbi:MAG TPA: helix-turn-helix transcriptional regulator [Anaerolineae bacterium]|nr:helix-turn-helix transcriptional regulator [Anaerolineae bacterium]